VEFDCINEHLVFRFLSLMLSQAHAWAAPVIVNEFDAGSFQCAANSHVIGGSHRSLLVCQFGASDRRDAQCCFASEIFRAPSDEGTGGSDLGTSKRL